MRANAIPRNEKCFPLSRLRLEDDEYACVVSGFLFPCFRWCHFLERPYRLYGLLETRNSRFERQIPLSSGIRRLEFDKLCIRCTNYCRNCSSTMINEGNIDDVDCTNTSLFERSYWIVTNWWKVCESRSRYNFYTVSSFFFYRNVKTDRFYSSRLLNSTSLAVNSFCGN